MDTRRPTMRLKSALLPTLGRPTIARTEATRGAHSMGRDFKHKTIVLASRRERARNRFRIADGLVPGPPECGRFARGTRAERARVRPRAFLRLPPAKARARISHRPICR